ncbi:MAG: Stp1/IreP family PP2C-type Ser/Thr phosphatase [Eubacteriales bacterium]
MKLWSITHRGAVREQNQDACRFAPVSDISALVAVCDGMGGALSGDVASRMAIDLFFDTFLASIPEDPIPVRLESAASVANAAVYKRASTDERCTGMGTTLVAALVQSGAAWIINEGDSRAYHISHNAITQITKDHSVVADLLAGGNLTAEEAKNYPYRNLITRALGAEDQLRADFYQIPFVAGEYLLLCSDGLSNILTNEEIHHQIIFGGMDDQCCERLLELALARGARDNVTVLLVAF